MASKSAENALSHEIQARIKDRRGLLWVCQRFDLNEGEEPHDYALPESAAQLLYRTSTSAVDRWLADFHWDAVWLEGARSPLLDALRSKLAQAAAPGVRRPVVLASEDDEGAKVNTEEFLEISVLPGVIGEGGGAGRYGQIKPRARERVAFGLTRRLLNHQAGVLIVMGARDEDDLSRLWDALDELPVVDLNVVVVTPTKFDLGPIANTGVKISVWSGDDEAFCRQLEAIHAPRATDVTADALFVKGKYLRFTKAELSRISKRWKIVLANEFGEPSKFDSADLIDFLSGNLDNLRGFGANAVVPRSYRSGDGKSLFEEALKQLEVLDTKQDFATSILLQLPAENGSGATTLARDSAIRLAAQGVPALILRPESTEIDVDELHSFTTLLWERALGASVSLNALVLVIDKEHQQTFQPRQVLQSLVAAGRGVLALQVVEAQRNHPAEARAGRRTILAPLHAEVTAAEVSACVATFEKLLRRWALNFDVPDRLSWDRFVGATQYVGQENGRTSFWVALRFFLTEGMDPAGASEAQNALGTWIQKRADRIRNTVMHGAMRFVALLSSYRIVAPLWTVLRPVTGGSFSSALVPALKELDGIVEWQPMQPALGDQVLRFSHPTMADEYLRGEGVTDNENRLRALRPLQAVLTTGREGDLFVAEALAFSAIAPKADERETADWETRLEAFEAFPPTVALQSKTILHHWARCLYLSADERFAPELEPAERKSRVSRSIDYLRKAIGLPSGRTQSEHPSHLHNTLGTAYARYATLLQREGGDQRLAEEAWGLACDEFNEAIRFSGHFNMDALLAFAHRLLDHAGARTGNPADTPEQVRDVVDALSLLEEASEMLGDHPNPEPSWQADVAQQKTIAFSALNNAQAISFIEDLRSEEPELALVCEVRLLLIGPADTARTNNALQLLERARDSGVPLTHRSLVLWINLLRRDEERALDFETLRDLHLRLERDNTYKARPIDYFRHAVLCYQLGNFAEGAQRFRTLRNQARREGFSLPRVRDVWRDSQNPRRARISSIRITKVISDFRGEGFVTDLGQEVPLRPRQFNPPPGVNDVVPCGIRFEANGPLAVPERFVTIRDRGR